MSDDEFDNIPDDFADVQDVDWARLLASPSLSSHTPLPRASREGAQSEAETHVPPPHSNSLDSSSSYFSDDDEMDASFLAELDRVEQRIADSEAPRAASQLQNSGLPSVIVTQTRLPGSSSAAAAVPTYIAGDLQSGDAAPQEPQINQSSNQQNSHYFQDRTTQIPSFPQILNVAASDRLRDVRYAPTIPSKRPHANDSIRGDSPQRKGKMKAADNFKQVLSNYEDELTCPICCDIFVASHVGNPCGHTFCGACGWHWHIENKNKGCPCCRKTLHAITPMIPNIAMDNIVERHVNALALGGDKEWEPGARKFLEWEGRKHAWRNGAKEREAKQTRQTTMAIGSVGPIQVFHFIPEDDVAEDPTQEDSDLELIPRPIQRSRRRRRSRR